MALGYGGGLLHWLLNTLYDGAEYATAGGFGQYWYDLMQSLGEWRDPTFTATLVPLLAIPLVSLLWPDPAEADDELSNEFYRVLKGVKAPAAA